MWTFGSTVLGAEVVDAPKSAVGASMDRARRAEDPRSDAPGAQEVFPRAGRMRYPSCFRVSIDTPVLAEGVIGVRCSRL